MASYRRPKGTVVRHVPDWNSAKLYYGFIQNSFSSAQDYFDGFTNFETDGSSLVIWDCTISLQHFSAADNSSQSADWLILPAVQQGPVIGFAPIDPFSASIMSTLNHNYDTSAALLTNTPFYAALSGQGTWQWPHEWPMAVIRPGWSFLVNFAFTNATAGLGVLVERTQYT